MRILIAEDDLTSRSMLSGVLKKAGHEVLEAANGAEAWEELQKPGSPRLLIIDWLMPRMDGLEVVRRARALPDGQPLYILMLTTKGDKADIIAGLNAGANDYLTKPFDPLELGARVQVGCRMVALQERLEGNILELQEALAQIKTLRGIVPICASCKKIRDDKGYWSQVEAYISAHSEARFSHGLCPSCMPRYFHGLPNGDGAGTVDS